MLSSMLSIGQSIKHISLSFNKDDFEFKRDKSGAFYIVPKQYEYFLQSDTLLPALPYIGYNVLVNNTDQYDAITNSCSKILVQTDVLMSPNPVEIPTSTFHSSKDIKWPNIYKQKIYPQQYVEYAGMDESNGYRFLSFHVCPFEYDAMTRNLYLRTSINIYIRIKHTSTFSKSLSHHGNRSKIRETIREMIINPEDLKNAELPATRTTTDNRLFRQSGYEYVIITSNQFKNAFQELASWKNHKGIRSKILTVEEIDTIYTGENKQERIKRALADIDSLSYVLLGGDTINVPTCMCYIGKEGNTDSITPADIYYACLGQMNWDKNRNGLYGELTDSVSLIPSFVVSRAPVSTVEDVKVFVNRIINYESAPDTTNWQDNILMSGTSEGSFINGVWQPYYDVTGESDTQIRSQIMYSRYIANPYNSFQWNGVQTQFYDTYTDISNDGTYDFSASNLQNELAKGYTFVDVMTHGTWNTWQMEGQNPIPVYNHSNASSLVNCGYTIITSTACLTNAFDFHATSHKCLSQHFMNNSQSGILAYLGTSRENWYNSSLINFGTGATFDGMTYRKLFEDEYHRMGKAVTAVKMGKASSASKSYNPNRKVWMGLNLMGDPEMPVYLSKPKSFHNVDIQFLNDSIYVNAGIEGFDICFINQSDSTDYYIARNISDSVAVFSRLNGAFDVCLTKPGYVPCSIICENSYLQNITLTATKNYDSKYVMIGSNVTNKLTQGPVVVNNGSTKIKARHGATITKDLVVNQGAEFIITNE